MRDHHTAPMICEYEQGRRSTFNWDTLNSTVNVEDVEMRDASRSPVPSIHQSTAGMNAFMNDELVKSQSLPLLLQENLMPTKKKPERSRDRVSVVDMWRQYSSMFMELPALLHEWAHLIYNLFLLCVLAYFVSAVVMSLYSDYTMKFKEMQQMVIQENTDCRRHYSDNRCLPDTRVPAMQQQCQEWEKCMHRDTKAIAATKISATVLAEILDTFVQTLSYKTILFIVVMLVLINSIKWLAGNVASDINKNVRRRRSSGVFRERRDQQYASRNDDLPLPPYYGSRGEFGSSGFKNFNGRRSRSLTPSRMIAHREHFKRRQRVDFSASDDDDDDNEN